MQGKGLKIVAVVISILVLSLGLTGFRPAHLLGENVLVLEVSGDVPETVPFNPFWGLFSPPPITMLDKVMLLKKAAADKRVTSSVIVIKDNSCGMGKVQELRDAIGEFRKSGKPAFCYIETEGDADGAYYLATSCEKIYVAPASFMSVNGLNRMYYFLGGLFQKVKLSIQVVKVKEYKTFGDMLYRRDMSPEQKEMEESLLNSVWEQYTNAVASARGKSRDEVIKLINQDLLAPDKFKEAGLIDGVKYLDEILKDLKGGHKEFGIISEREYLNIPAVAMGFDMGPKVAVIFGEGNIVNVDPGTSPFTGSVMSAERMVKELETVAKDDTIKGVIFRIDSGGGSALASDLIWRATQEVREKKPIVVSMSDVAGSGGYYIACGADAIVAHPGTMTGSIGVVSAHIGMKDLLGWLQVGTATLGRGTYADIDDTTRPWTDAEMAKSMEGIEGLYQLFLDRVSRGRKINMDDVNKIGRGRVWTGMQAKENGLVDQLGGLDAAADIIKKKLGVKSVMLVYRHKQVSLWKILTGKVEEDLVSATLGPQGVELRKIMAVNGLYKDGERLFLSPAVRME